MTLSEPLWSLFLKHLRAPERDLVTLRAQVAQHLAHLALSASNPKTPHIDLSLARKICDGCLTLLAGFDRRTRTERRSIQAACAYFIDEDDAIHDTLSVVGLEDDAEVLNYVATLLGRRDLVIDLTSDEGHQHLDD